MLVGWLRHDILTVAGPCYTERCDCMILSWPSRRPGPRSAPTGSSRSAALWRTNATICLPSHAGSMRIWSNSDRSCKIPRNSHDGCSKRSRVTSVTPGVGRGSGPAQELRGRFHAVQLAVAALAEETVRASSLVENLNSRLRSYFFLRRHLGPDYLALLPVLPQPPTAGMQ